MSESRAAPSRAAVPGARPCLAQRRQVGTRTPRRRTFPSPDGGAGKLATTIARAATAAGYDVAMSGSSPADDIALTVDVLARGARAVKTAAVARDADIIFPAVPTHRFRHRAAGDERAA